MSSFRDSMTKAIRAGATPEAAYDFAVAEVDKDDLAVYFRPVGVDEARGIRRTLSRVVENHVFGKGGRRLEITKETPDRYMVVTRAFLEATFSVGSRTLTWGTATADEHEQRAAEQEERASDLLVDADRHRRAAKKLRETGAETLEELDDDVLEELVA